MKANLAVTQYEFSDFLLFGYLNIGIRIMFNVEQIAFGKMACLTACQSLKLISFEYLTLAQSLLVAARIDD